MMVSLKFLLGKKRLALILACFLVSTLFTGCGKNGKSLFTTVLGTSVGSTIGAAVSKDKKKGAMVGAVVGGVAGTAASIALGGGAISIAYGLVTTFGSVLVNSLARKKNKSDLKNGSNIYGQAIKGKANCINEK